MDPWVYAMGVDPHQELARCLGRAQLPSFPALQIRILDTLRDPDAHTSRLVELIAADPGLTVQLLRAVNTAAFGAPGRVSSVSQAVRLPRLHDSRADEAARCIEGLRPLVPLGHRARDAARTLLTCERDRRLNDPSSVPMPAVRRVGPHGDKDASVRVLPVGDHRAGRHQSVGRVNPEARTTGGTDA